MDVNNCPNTRILFRMGFDPARQKQHPLSIIKPWCFLHGTAHEVYRAPIPSLCTALNFCYKTGWAAGPCFLRYHLGMDQYLLIPFLGG